MATIHCGSSIRVGAFPEGAAGCLVNFADAPERVMLLTAGHVVVSGKSQQNDPVGPAEDPNAAFGTLRTWSELEGETTIDAALIWVDPTCVTTSVPDLGGKTPAGINATPKVGEKLRLVSRTGVRETTIDRLQFGIDMSVSAAPLFFYANQIRCNPSVSEPGDSGAMVFDTSDRIVGMLVGGSRSVGDLVTPIDAILRYPGWNGVAQVVTSLPPNAIAPPFTGLAAFSVASAATPAPLPVALPPPKSTRFADLQARYDLLFAACVVKPERAKQVDALLGQLRANRARYEAVANTTGAPWWFIGIVHGLEGSFNFHTHLHNGDPLNARTVHEPKGRPAQWNPPLDWESSAADAIAFESLAHVADWSLTRALYRFEGFNGYGYYKVGVNSPYLWSFSSLYERGKFVADHKFDAGAVSAQCGAAVLLKALIAAGDVAL